MARKILILTDPGIDTAVAVALALADSDIEVLGVAATAGNVSAQKASTSLYALVELLDPPRSPRFGAALPIDYERDASNLHGPDGLGGLNLPEITRHHPTPSDKLISELAREYPGELTVLVLGPLSVLARALDRDPELCRLIGRLIVAGGCWREPGDVSPVAEFHFSCDPEATRQVLRCGAPMALLPLDVTRKLILSPGDLRQLPEPETRTGSLLQRVVPSALVPTAGLYGVEGVYLDAVMPLVALTCPSAFTTRPVHAEIETRGELTRGMSVFDTRWGTTTRPNVDLVTDVDLAVVRQYVFQTMSSAR